VTERTFCTNTDISGLRRAINAACMMGTCSMQGLACVCSYQDAACSTAACYHIHAFPDKREADWQLRKTQLFSNMHWCMIVHAPLRSFCHNLLQLTYLTCPKSTIACLSASTMSSRLTSHQVHHCHQSPHIFGTTTVWCAVITL